MIDAATFYDHPTSQPVTPAEPHAAPLPPEKTAEQEISEALFAGPQSTPAAAAVEVPGAIKTLRASDATATFYGETEFVSPSVLEQIFDGADLDQIKQANPDADPVQVLAAARSEIGRMAQDVGATPADLTQWVGFAREAQNATPRQLEDWADDAAHRLSQIHGSDFEAAITDAERLLARDPRAARLLHDSGLLHRGDVVIRLIGLARSEKARGRL